ncbi:MAG TPA: phosphatidylglycerophosphatase A [Kofleriaceae bacterium]|nr:phosphatidylglycerophosphatase A [Kofleriaceae bacterium]
MARPLVTVPARALATAGGAGYSPVAPGTCGTAVAVPLAWLASGLPLWSFIAITVAVTLVGVWAASVADDHWGTHDSGRIVIDEVAGYFVTMCFADRSTIGPLLLGFVLFRAFDIVKPPPVRWIDRAGPGGVGVVFDDVAAGVYAGLILLVLTHTSLPGRISALFG